MLPGNNEVDVETKVREFLESEGGWARVGKCEKAYSKRNLTKKTTFYRWLKKIKEGKVKGFQMLPLFNNISFIGLEGADPNKVLQSIVSGDVTGKRMKSFFERFKRKKNVEQLFTDREAAAVAYFSQHETRFMRNFIKNYIWLKRGAKPEEKPELESRD